MHASVRSLFHVIGGVVIIFLIAAAWLGLRLSEGPVELDFLSPYIEDALTTPDLSVHLGSTQLVRAEGVHVFEIHARSVRVMAGDTLALAIPDMTISLSLSALLKGEVAPRSLKLIHPSLRLVRGADGTFRLGPKPGRDAVEPAASVPLARNVLETLMAPPGGDGLTGQLVGLSVTNGELLIEDEGLGRQWSAPEVDLSLRRDREALNARVRMSVETGVAPVAERLSLAGEAAIFRDSGTFHGTLSFDGLKPPDLAPLAPILAPLADLRFVTSGSVVAEGTLSGGLAQARFDLSAGSGSFVAPDLQDLSWPFRSFSLRGSIDDNLDSATIETLRIDLGGPTVEAKAHAEGLSKAPKFTAEASVADLPTDDLKTYWPAMLAPSPRAWVLTNLSKGVVNRASVHLAGHVPERGSVDDIVLDEVGGEVLPTGVTVQYLPPMPVVKNVAADCHFDAEKFEIVVRSGELYGLTVPQGKIVLSGLSQPDQFGAIDLVIKGPLSDALKVIDSKPLNYASALGLPPGKVKGDTSIALSLSLPLIAQISLDQVKVGVKAETSHVAIPEVVLGQDLTDANLSLAIDTKGLDLAGKGGVAGVPSEIVWHENFSRAAPFRSRYRLQGVFDDAARAKLGLSDPFQAPFITGPVPIDVSATLGDGGTGDIQVKADLGAATMALPGFNWVKGPGAPAAGSAEIKVAHGRLAQVPNFSVQASTGALSILGKASFTQGSISQIVFDKAHWGRSELKGTLSFRKDAPVAAYLSGVFDAREVISGVPTDLPPGMTPPEKHPHDRTPVTPLSVSASFSRVWVGDEGALTKVTAEMRRDEHDWQDVTLDGMITSDQPLHIEIHPAGHDKRSFKLASGDAGAVFRALGIFDNVAGGKLAIDAAFDDSDIRQPLKGTATIADFRLTKAPALARLLTVAALTGVVDVLSGRGISFSSLEAPFTLTDGLLELTDARASGTELGLTAKGQIDLDHDRVALEGTIIPAYVLNSALGRIPLIGGLFSAEKGGGIIAMNYSLKGPSNDPSTMVNPLSALTPGFLRRFFNIFDDGSSTEARPKEDAPEAGTSKPGE